MQVTEIAVSEKRSVTVGTTVQGKTNYEKREYFTSLSATTTADDTVRDCLVGMSGTVAAHNLKLIRNALEDSGEQTDKLVEKRQTQMAPTESVKEQTFTKMTPLAACAKCGDEIKNEKTLELAKRMGRPAMCFPCYKGNK